MSIAGRIKARIALTALSLLALVGMSAKTVAQRQIGRSKYLPHDGARAQARRRRQIESGMLRAANGLDIASYRALHGR